MIIITTVTVPSIIGGVDDPDIDPAASMLAFLMVAEKAIRAWYPHALVQVVAEVDDVPSPVIDIWEADDDDLEVEDLQRTVADIIDAVRDDASAWVVMGPA